MILGHVNKSLIQHQNVVAKLVHMHGVALTVGLSHYSDPSCYCGRQRRVRYNDWILISM